MSVQGIEDIYAMTPLQQGLLFHGLLTPQSGLYVDQIVLDLHGSVDVPAMESAWQQVVKRHAVLRTSFHWESLNKPVQVVHREVNLSLEVSDWRDRSPELQKDLLAAYLKDDGQRGFDVSAAPLMRLALIQTRDNAYHFVWSFHHLILDGWSTAIVHTEVLVLYEALSRGERLELEPVTPFSAYVAWLRRQDLAAAESFWRRKLKGFRHPLALAFDRPQSGSQLPEIDRMDREIRLPLELTAELGSFARKHHLTLSTVLLGAWTLLLSRYTREPEIVVGVVVSGRPETVRGVEAIVGNFINTVPERIEVSSDNLVNWLRRLQATQLELRNYEYTPLVEIQKWSDVPAGQPLFESIFVFENSISGDFSRKQVNSLRIDNVRHLFKTNYPITVQVSPAQNLAIRIEYDCRRFGADTIVRMLNHLETLLRRCIAAPYQSIAGLSLVSEEEKRQLARNRNATRAAYSDSSSLSELFEAQARKTPDAVALEFENRQVTYEELDAQANKLACYLRGFGVGPEVRVAVCMSRCLEMVVSSLGVLKAGGVCVPLDPEYPKERLAFMMQDTRASLVLTHALVAERLPEQTEVTVVHVDHRRMVVAQEGEAHPPGGTQANNLAYIIYTSGSTGSPKGVEISHLGIVRLVVGQNYIDLNGTETFLHLSPASFDASFFEIWGALLHGGRCVVLGSGKFSTFELGRAVEEHGVDVLWLTASLFNSVVDENAQALSGVRQLLTGGEPLSVAHVGRSLERLPNTQIINGYGPTENTTFSCCYRIPRRPDSKGSSIPIGHPIAGTQACVLDEHLNPLPVGVAGDLYVSGDGLARGYLNDPVLTAWKFVPDPYSEDAGARMYRTGDLARYLDQGDLEFLGRRDEQVKVRGFRIEPGEVEMVLQQHPKVRQAAAVMKESAAGDKRLVAYLVAERGAHISGGELRAFLSGKLPEYMIPSAYVELESMPLTPNGKADRRALSERELEVVETSASHAAPRTVVEEMLAQIWSGVLSIGKAGIHDDFLDLGGHSLLAIQLISRIREAFQIELPLRALFESPTIAGLASEIEKELGMGSDVPPAPLVRSSREGDLPLSFAQERLWIIDRLEPGLPVYNVPIGVSIRGRLNIAALADALNGVVGRHEVLRSNVETREGLPIQVIAPTPGLRLRLIDLEALAKGDREPEALRLGVEEARRRFDLSTDNLLRATLIRLDVEEYVLVLTMHHIVADEWSLEILLREVAKLYADFSNGDVSSLPALPIQYADFAVWQREWLQGERLDRQLAHWRGQLRDAPAGLELVSDRKRPAVQTFRGSRQTIELSPQLSEALKLLSRNERATLFMTLLAAFKCLLHRYTGQQDLLVGTVVANRDRVETEGLIGFFVNTLVLRTDFSGNRNFRQVLSRVREGLLAAHAHKDVPFEKLIGELQPQRDLSLSPLFQVLFAYQSATASRTAIPGLSLTFKDIETGTAKFDLSLTMVESEQGLSGSLEYNKDLYDETTIDLMLKHLVRLLEGVTADPELPISQQPLLSAAEEIQLAEWNDTALNYPRELCIQELFERQAEQTPDAVALECGEQRLTYRALDRSSNQLAHRLRNLGVGQEVVVGVFMKRTPELVTALLAILKAGGAYLPLDPAYPKERMSFMLADVCARVLLTEECLLESLPPHGAEVVLLNGETREYAQEPTTRQRAASPQNLAYLIYTSGSTGRPKGVAIEHRNAVAFLHWVREIYSSGELSGVLATTSICFDISIFELFAPLSWGGTTILVENALSLLTLNPTDRVTLVDVVPSAMAEVLRATPLPDSVRTVNLPGEPIPAELITRLYQQKNVERIYNLYGPSEDTTYSTFALAERGSLRPPPAGRPIANSQVFLLDKELNRCPLRVAGEVFIGGDGLSRGYYDRSDLTAERFVPNPFCTQPGERMYRTGDLARYRPDGQIEVLGRADHQVKVRGFRVELGEIEAALINHNAVREAVVLAREDVLGDKRLVAYVVPQSEATPSRGELQSFLREKLPDYLIPSGFVMLDSLPVLPNGKINRAALPPPANMRSNETEEYVSPPDELEDAIAAVWQGVLGAPKVGVHDNFFSDLGGHSLLAIQTVTRLREALAPEMSFVAMFQFPTVASLAEHLRSGGNWQPSNQRVDDYALERREALRRHRLRKNSRPSVSAVRKEG